MFLISTNPVIERLRLPEGFEGAIEQLVCLTRGVPLPALHDAAQRVIRHRPQYSMNVIWHHHPRIQPIALVREETKRARDQVCDFSPPKRAVATAFVEVF